MGMSAAERMRKYRQSIKEDESRYREYLVKERNRYKERRNKGGVKLIETCEQREKNLIRRKWKIERRERRKKKKESEALVHQADNIMGTPPNSPIPGPSNEPESENRNKRGRKKVQMNRSKAYREIQKLKDQLKKKSKEADKYRKRWERESKKTGSKLGKTTNTKTKIRLKKKHNSYSKTALFNSLIVQEIRMKMLKLKKEKDKQILSKALTGNILKRYNLTCFVDRLGISRKRIQSNKKRTTTMTYERKKYQSKIGIQLRRKVCSFLEEDVNSRALPGKKDVISRKGLMKPKRTLNDNMKRLHEKFCKEHPFYIISYTSFLNLKPFWIVHPSCNERDTCGCKLHMNAAFMISRLVEYKVLDSKSNSESCKRVVCNIESKACMYNECERCKNMQIVCPEGMNHNTQVWIHSWENDLEERIISKPNGKSEVIKVRVVIKKKVQLTLNQLVEKFSEYANKQFCKHLFNITHQFHKIKSLKDTLNDTECVIHVDFSENYACKYSAEVQGVHYGASRNQVSMHTGVLYQAGKPPQSFCTMSENTRHDPSAIWAHLDPILQEVRQNGVTMVHFVSDGPTTQYRSRNHFFLMKEKVHRHYGFSHVTWNFSESGHGKGAPDGVGGLIKHKADQMVSHGSDITNAQELYNAVKHMSVNVNVHLIPTSKISEIDSEIPANVKLVKGTMSVHQVFSHITEPCIWTRVLSCFCNKLDGCKCYEPIKAILHEQNCSLGIGSTSNVVTVSTQPVESNDTVSSVGDTAARTQLDGEMNTERSVGNMTAVSTQSDGAMDTVSSKGDARDMTGKSKSNFALSPLSTDLVDESLIGQWCVVLYDSKPFPGIILDCDTDSTVQVKVFHNIGINRWFEPFPDDVFWYKVPDQFVTLIPELLKVTSRHKQILPQAWTSIMQSLDLDVDLKYR